MWMQKGPQRSHEDIQPTRQPNHPIPLPIRPIPRILGIAPRTPDQIIPLLILMREVDVFLFQCVVEVRVGMFQLDVGFAGFRVRVE